MTVTIRWCVDVDKARKLGLDEFVQANPSKFMHAELFRTLQKLTLDYRLNDIYTCLVCTCLSLSLAVALCVRLSVCPMTLARRRCIVWLGAVDH